jgi:hypothetical protein
MPLENIQARATLKVRHERPYSYDERRGHWLYERLDEDEEYFNILTNAGRVAIHTFIYGTSAQRASVSLGSGLHFIGVSNNSSAPVAGDTSLADELSADGLGRAIGTVTLPTGVGTITQIQRQFTYTGGGTQGVQKAALFDLVAGGHMAHELLFNQRLMNTNDTLTLIFNVTVA